MAQQDKTDWYWNGALAGAVNNLYYDLINVDVCHVPYATNHRNSSFFLKTRLAYKIDNSWDGGTDTNGYEVTDVKILREEECDKESGTVYAIGKKGKEKAIFAASISDGCVGAFFNCSKNCTPRGDSDFYDECPDMDNIEGCGDWKLFSTDFVKGDRYDGSDILGGSGLVEPGVFTGIQINKYNLGTTLGYFSDEYVESGEGEFKGEILEPGNYLLVYASGNDENDGHAGQVRMITGVYEDANGKKWIQLDSPWLGFKVIDTSTMQEGEERLQKGYHVSYAVFKDWGEVIGFTDSNKIYLLTWNNDCKATRLYTQDGEAETNIISVTDCNDKIFILTDNGYVHYSKEGTGYNKFFIDDDMFAGTDKTSIVGYRDMLLAFGRKHISLGVPDEQNRFWTMYNQSATIGTRSRYSYAEYNGDMVFVSNDKRLLTLKVSSAGRYGLEFQERPGTELLNGKLSALIPGDEVFVGSEDNNLKVFVNTKPVPYVPDDYYTYNANINTSAGNTMTHIYKFDTLFKVWTEDHIEGTLIKGAIEGVYYGEDGIYTRINGSVDAGGGDIITRINAYLIENENNGLDGHPTLFQLAKLNRLITALGPGIYSDVSKIRITTYSKGIGYTYEFPINGDGNDWVGLMTTYYQQESLDYDEREKIECMLSTLQDSQKQYQPNCPDGDVYRQDVRQNRPWCGSYTEMITESHGVCINDKLYELAPTMPLTTDLGENQPYATQIKIELIGGKGDIICFGGWLAELFIAPLFQKGPDGEYQLQPNTDCD